MVVFGDSISDVGRRFNAPASFDYEDIGPFPWTNLFAESDDSDVSFLVFHRLLLCVATLTAAVPHERAGYSPKSNMPMCDCTPVPPRGCSATLLETE